MKNDESLSRFLFKMWRFTVSRFFFEKFRNNSVKNYGLCPIHYYSSVAFSWDGMLNMTRVKIKLISDPEMHLFLK